MKKLSIITICYNEPHLEKTCESIVNQTWQDFEWIVVDGGSKKETLQVFDKYKSRIDKFISEPDNGIYNACNKGIKLAEGEYVIFMNAGDVFYSEDVIQLVSASMDTINADVIYGENECSFKNKDLNSITHYPQTMTAEFFIKNNICTQSTFVKKEIFDIFGGFNEQYKIVADYHKWLQLFKAGKTFKYIPIVISSYDMNGISNNSNHLVKKERNEVMMEFIPLEVNEYEKKEKVKYNLWENIFSVKNSTAGLYKIFTVLGFHIKKRRNFI